MPLSINQLADSLRNITGQDTVGLPDSDAGATTGAFTFLNRSFWSIANKYNFRAEELTINGATQAGIPNTAVPFLDSVVKVSLLDPTTKKYFVLPPMSLDVYRGLQGDITDDTNQTMPTNYIRFGSDLIFYPTPDALYSYQLDQLQTLSDILTTQTPPIPREWHEAILYGAAWRVFSDVNGDLARAQWYKNLEANLNNTIVPVQAKEEMDYSNAGVNVKGRSY